MFRGLVPLLKQVRERIEALEYEREGLKYLLEHYFDPDEETPEGMVIESKEKLKQVLKNVKDRIDLYTHGFASDDPKVIIDYIKDYTDIMSLFAFFGARLKTDEFMPDATYDFSPAETLCLEYSVLMVMLKEAYPNEYQEVMVKYEGMVDTDA